MKIDGLIFNERNIEHIARHSVLPEEIKEVIEGKILPLQAKLGRIMVVGKTKKGRRLAIILEKIEGNIYFPVTARDADRKERRIYTQEMGGENANGKNSN